MFSRVFGATWNFWTKLLAYNLYRFWYSHHWEKVFSQKCDFQSYRGMPQPQVQEIQGAGVT